jgi:flagellar motor component MotA
MTAGLIKDEIVDLSNEQFRTYIKMVLFTLASNKDPKPAEDALLLLLNENERPEIAAMLEKLRAENDKH